jgi:hypothetical protein
MGTYYLMLEEWDYREVQDFDCLDQLWQKHQNDDEHVAVKLALDLNKHLGLGVVDLNSEQSRFFKDYLQRGWKNRGIMVKEIDVIRQEEGW